VNGIEVKNFSFSHRIVTVSLTITKISSGTSDKLSDNNSGRITSSVRNFFCSFQHGELVGEWAAELQK
jgi:hypothetical protein